MDRLAGDGKEGGGIPLPPLFQTILNEIQDHGHRSIPDLVDPVSWHTKREERVVWMYQAPTREGSWELLIHDALEQMETRHIVQSTPQGWTLGEKFKTGRPMVVIPKREHKHHGAVPCTVYPRAQREERDAVAMAKAGKQSAAYHLNPAKRGFRPLSTKRVETIRKSIEEFGKFDEAQPVLVDQDGRILDGRHRLAADPTWHRNVIQVADDFEAIAISWVANEGSPWDKKDREQFARLLLAEGYQPDQLGKRIGRKAKRMLIEQALLSNPELSDRATAELVGCKHDTVGVVRAELVANGQMAIERSERKTATGKKAPGRKPRKTNDAAAKAVPAPSSKDKSVCPVCNGTGFN